MKPKYNVTYLRLSMKIGHTVNVTNSISCFQLMMSNVIEDFIISVMIVQAGSMHLLLLLFPIKRAVKRI